MKRTFKLHITIKDGKITYSMELDRDNTVTKCHGWQDPKYVRMEAELARERIRMMVAKVRAILPVTTEERK